MHIRPATPDDAALLHELAAATFPLACPPDTLPASIESFIATNLSVDSFTAYLSDPARLLFVGEIDGVASGYTMVVFGEPGDADVAASITARPTAELSKCYVRSEHHGSGLADALLAAAHADLAGRTVDGVPLAAVWLGTNRGNRRARRFYARAGYRVVGARRFRVGAVLHHDVVMVRPLGTVDAAGR